LVDRVITNFIVNAIRYVDKKLKIRISTENLKDTVKISFYNSCDSVTIDELPKLWDAFYKVDDSRNRTNEGHGLGLSIVKNIQETLGLGYGVKLVDGGIIFWFEINKK
jgi:signal transduction histidine kinase